MEEKNTGTALDHSLSKKQEPCGRILFLLLLSFQPDFLRNASKRSPVPAFSRGKSH